MPAKLIVALDMPSTHSLGMLLQKLPEEIEWYKIGLELFAAEGPRALEALRAIHKKIFLDLKLHDIPNTVERAVAAAAQHNIGLLTLHAAGGRAMLSAAARAAKAAGPGAPKLIAVTTLTSLNQADLADTGINRDIGDQAIALAELALDAGLDGLVASAREVESLRRRFGSKPLIVTPGIRPSFAQGATEGRPSCAQGASAVAKEAMPDKSEGSPAGNIPDDQKRAATPGMAVRAGADFLVVGRPILQAADPRAAATAILNEIRNASGAKN